MVYTIAQCPVGVVYTPALRILLNTLNNALYQVKIDGVVSHNVDGNVLFEEILHAEKGRPKKMIIGFIDTGTSLLVGPKRDIEAFAKNAGAHPYSNAGGYVLETCDPSKVPSLSFKIKGREYVLSGSNLVMVRSTCIFIFTFTLEKNKNFLACFSQLLPFH